MDRALRLVSFAWLSVLTWEALHHAPTWVWQLAAWYVVAFRDWAPR